MTPGVHHCIRHACAAKKMWGCASPLGRLLALPCLCYQHDNTCYTNPLPGAATEKRRESKPPLADCFSRAQAAMYQRRKQNVPTSGAAQSCACICVPPQRWQKQGTDAHNHSDEPAAKHTTTTPGYKIDATEPTTACAGACGVTCRPNPLARLHTSCCAIYNGPALQWLLSTQGLQHHMCTRECVLIRQ
jgi:hypothetical protein